MKGTPVNLIRILYGNGPVPAGRWPLVALYFLRSLIMVPLSLAERLFCYGKIRGTVIQQPPVFILGHYRSGTTYLHKVLTADKRFGYINTYNIFFPFSFNWMEKMLKPILQGIFNMINLKQIHYHDYNINFDDPLEEDLHMLISLCPSSAFLMEVFPHNALKYIDRNILFEDEKSKEEWRRDYLYCLKRFTWKNNGKPLILKNPPNTGRIRLLLEMFPGAKFIFIHRNPYQVYYSTRNLWEKALEKYYALHEISDTERDEIIFTLYDKIMHRYLEEKDLIPEENLVEISYEEFEKDPYGEIEKIYRDLRLPDLAEASGDIKKRLDGEKKYTKFSYKYDDKVLDKIYDHWGFFIDKWHYKRMTGTASPVLQQ